MLVLGSRNRKKCREMAELLAPSWEPSPPWAQLEIRPLDDFPDAPEVVEDADTFAGNARKKASELARATSRWVVADDSGLTVNILDGAPGYSRRGTRASPATMRPTIASCWKPSPTCPTIAAARRSAAPWHWLAPTGPFASRPRAPAGDA